MYGFPPNSAQLYKSLVDIISCDKFFSDRLRDVDSVGSKMKGSHRLSQWLLTNYATAPPVMQKLLMENLLRESIH